MVDEDILELNSLAREGLKMLHASGALAEQIERIALSFLQGDTDEPVDVVAKLVLVARQRISSLRTLDDLGAQYSKEQE